MPLMKNTNHTLILLSSSQFIFSKFSTAVFQLNIKKKQKKTTTIGVVIGT